jgi:hypothetical protein
MIEIVAIMVAWGAGHEHVEELKRRDRFGSGRSTTQAPIGWLSEDGEHREVVAGTFRQVQVEVVRPAADPPYVRGRAHGLWTDGLLALPALLR